ncbi:hypothetical protein QQ045_024236 [Rhodiola kirilowii]
MSQNVQSSSESDPPPPFDPSQPSAPISYPLKTLEELDSRVYFNSFHYPFNISSVPLQTSTLPYRPRILVCHDMEGGYTDDDKWVQGGSNTDAYAIWHWYLMDVFVYFSHNLVTLPPPGWTNAAHKHGVKVLGTFITEWDEGRVICNKLLATKESSQKYAELLVELAVALHFDGWLLNLEVALDIEQIPNLLEFVSHLTETMHSSSPGSLVLWYDSVTFHGNLSWQDQLNDENKPFFDKCDGIFVNYTWKEDYPKISAAVAGDRKFDVYMGIDVFGRGTYGGGQWTTNVALDVLKKDSVSAAIFAPGWVYETKQPPDFQTAQNHWWSLVENSWGILQKYPKVLPFYSDFDQGRAYHYSIDGIQVSDSPWCNLSLQSAQPFLKLSGNSNPDNIQVLVDLKEASYSQGGNITFKGSLDVNAYFSVRLFLGELSLGNLPIYLEYSVNTDGSSLVGLSLNFTKVDHERASVLLAASGCTIQTLDQLSSNFSKVIMPCQVTKSLTAPRWVVQESSLSMNDYTLTEIHAVCYESLNPRLSEQRHALKTPVKGDAVIGFSSKFDAVIGHITIKASKEDLVFPPSTAWLVEVQYLKWTIGSGSNSLSVKIIWKLRDYKDSSYPKYNIFAEKLTKREVLKKKKAENGQQYLGAAVINAFYVSDFEVSSSVSKLRFIVQVCNVDGTSQKLEECPSLLLDVEGMDVDAAAPKLYLRASIFLLLLFCVSWFFWVFGRFIFPYFLM